MDNAQKKEIIRCVVAYVHNRLPPSYNVKLTDRIDYGLDEPCKLALTIGEHGATFMDCWWPSIDAFFNGCIDLNGTRWLSFFDQIRCICLYVWADKPTVNAIKPLLAIANMKTYEEMKMFFDINS